MGPTSLGFCRTRFRKKNQKSKNEFLKTTCVALEKELRKNLNFFQQVSCPHIFAKVTKLFLKKNRQKIF